MSEVLDKWLIESVDAWCDLSLPSLPRRLQHWRGTIDASDFATHQPSDQDATATGYPSYVVIAEYARWALSENGTDDAIELLKEQADRVLARHYDIAEMTRLAHAITSTMLAAVAWKRQDGQEVCQRLAAAARLNDSVWKMNLMRAGVASPSPSDPYRYPLDVSTSDQAAQALEMNFMGSMVFGDKSR